MRCDAIRCDDRCNTERQRGPLHTGTSRGELDPLTRAGHCEYIHENFGASNHRDSRVLERARVDARSSKMKGLSRRWGKVADDEAIETDRNTGLPDIVSIKGQDGLYPTSPDSPSSLTSLNGWSKARRQTASRGERELSTCASRPPTSAALSSPALSRAYDDRPSSRR